MVSAVAHLLFVCKGREVRFVKTDSGLKALEDHRSLDVTTSE